MKASSIEWNEPKRNYKPDSPGAKRSASMITLSSMKKLIKSGIPHKLYKSLGELGPINPTRI